MRRRNPFSFLITPASPLIIEADYTGTWLALRDWMMPVAIMPMPLMGATAPGSRLGTVLTANCETIGTLTLVQTAAPGTPVIYAPVLATMDPRSGRYAAGAIEQAVMSAAGVAMARFYGLPVEASGSSSETYEPGIQAAYEKMALALGVTLAWPDILVGPGQLGGAILLSFEQLVHRHRDVPHRAAGPCGSPGRRRALAGRGVVRRRAGRQLPAGPVDAAQRPRRRMASDRLRRP